MKILLTNDDGINSQGLQILAKRLSKNHQITVVAPFQQKSSISHCITLHNPIRILKVEKKNSIKMYSVDGTPADCIKLALCEILKSYPDLVVSGINLGPNTGINIFYSGTVAGAIEAAFKKIPSIAVSVDTPLDLRDIPSIRFISSFVSEFISKNFNIISKYSPLNINFPNLKKRRLKGVLFTTQELSPYVDNFTLRYDPRRVPYYWVKGNLNSISIKSIKLDGKFITDYQAVKNGYVSITPLNLSLVNLKALKILNKNYIK